MKLRPYQQAAYEATYAEFQSGVKRTCCVMSTGLGKTVTAAAVARDWPDGRVMFLAHRDELISQAWKTFSRVTGETPDIEQGAENRANENSFYGRSQFVIASVQSLHPRRLTPDRFNDIGLVIIDECHHASVATSSYGRVLRTLRDKNPDVCSLGYSATPSRADGKSILFDSFCFDYGLRKAIDDGWLVKPKSQMVVIEGLDFSEIRKNRNDFNQQDLAEVMEQEGPLHEIASVTVAETDGLQTMMFAASVRQARELSAVINRYKPGSSDWVCGDERLCPRPTRRDIVRRFRDGDLQYIVNCSIFLEGADFPGIQCIGMAKPTRSVPLAAQMYGRGVRPLTGILDHLNDATADERKAAIAASAKPYVKILDFVDQSRHPCVTACDPGILGGEYSEAEVAQAKKQIEQNSQQGELSDVDIELAKARKLLEQMEEEKRQRERERLVAKASYSLVEADPLKASTAGAVRRVERQFGKPVTDKQAAKLREYGYNPHQYNRKEAQKICFDIHLGKIKKPKPTPAQHAVVNGATEKQKRVLSHYGYSTNCTEAQAAEIITREINQRKDLAGPRAPAYSPPPPKDTTGGANPKQQMLLERFGFQPNVSYAEAARIIQQQINPQLASKARA